MATQAFKRVYGMFGGSEVAPFKFLVRELQDPNYKIPDKKYSFLLQPGLGTIGWGHEQ